VCNGAAKQASAGVAPCNMVGFIKLFWTSVARQVSRKVELLSTSATVATIAVVIKQEFRRVTPLREICLTRLRFVSQSENRTASRPWFIASVQSKLAEKNNVLRPVSTFYVLCRCNACWNLFHRPVVHKFQGNVSTRNSGLMSTIAHVETTLNSNYC